MHKIIKLATFNATLLIALLISNSQAADLILKNALTYTTAAQGNQSNYLNELFLGFKVESLKTFLYMPVTKSVEGDTETKLGDVQLRMAAPIFKNNLINVIAEGRLRFPTSEASREIKDLTTSVTLTPTILFDLGKAENAEFGAMIKPYYTESFYGQKLRLDGYPNIERSLAFLMSLNTTLYKDLFVEVLYYYATNWNTLGSRVDDEYTLSQEVTYSFNKHVSLLAGHSTGDNFYDNAGVERAISLFDDQTNRYYLILTLSY